MKECRVKIPNCQTKRYSLAMNVKTLVSLFFVICLLELNGQQNCEDLVRQPYIQFVSQNEFELRFRALEEDRFELHFEDHGIEILDYQIQEAKYFVPVSQPIEAVACFDDEGEADGEREQKIWYYEPSNVYDHKIGFKTPMRAKQFEYHLRNQFGETICDGSLNNFQLDRKIQAYVLGDCGKEQCLNSTCDGSLSKSLAALQIVEDEKNESADFVLLLGDHAYGATMENIESLSKKELAKLKALGCDDPTTEKIDEAICNQKYSPDGMDYAMQQTIFNPMANVLKSKPIMTTVGNHESDYSFLKEVPCFDREGNSNGTSQRMNIEDYFNIFSAGDRYKGYYSQMLGNVHIIVLNSNINKEAFNNPAETIDDRMRSPDVFGKRQEKFDLLSDGCEGCYQDLQKAANNFRANEFDYSQLVSGATFDKYGNAGRVYVLSGAASTTENLGSLRQDFFNHPIMVPFRAKKQVEDSPFADGGRGLNVISSGILSVEGNTLTYQQVDHKNNILDHFLIKKHPALEAE